MNPELELLRFLTERGFEHIAALEGWVSYEGRPLEATLAILQRVRPLARRRLGARARHARRRRARVAAASTRARLGEVTAVLHNALASDPTDPHFAPEEPSTEALALLSASIDEEIEQVFVDAAGASTALEPIARAAARRCATACGADRTSATSGKVIRHHGDFHLGQALWTNDGRLADPRLRGRAGAGRCPSGAASARRSATSPGCSARSPTRRRRRSSSVGSSRPTGWEERCRDRLPRGLPRRGRAEPAAGRASSRSSGC